MSEDGILEEAAGWFVRQQDDAMDWEGFTAWLEADPRHRRVFDALCNLDTDLDSSAPQLKHGRSVPRLAANDRGPSRWGRWAGLSGAVAAILAIILVTQPLKQEIPTQDYRSAVGQMQQVALAGGAQIALAPSSHLRVKGEQIALEGTAYFNVPHKEGRQLSIRAGGFTVADIGTQFSIANEAGLVSIDVAEGRLSVASERLDRPISLTAGRGMKADGETVRLTQLDPRKVGMWREGKLQFDNSPLSLVVRDISRYSGTVITVDPSIGNQPFSGVITIDHGDAAARNLAQIMALEARPVDGGFRLEPRRH